MSNFFNNCYDIIMYNDIQKKCQTCNELYQILLNNKHSLDFTPLDVIMSIPVPGRPKKPDLVHPFDVPKRRIGSPDGHAGLIHALAHIEFNAINLALDACYRFQNMPSEYYQNWLQVAAEESYHFTMLNEHLHELGFSYGSFAAHNGLWSMALKTENNLLARMALVPRTLEARGIDAIPEMQQKLQTIKDTRAIEILDIIHQDEIKHVLFGDKWFKYECAKHSLNAETEFFRLFDEYDAPKIRGSFNRLDRKKAGFSDFELDKLQIL